MSDLATTEDLMRRLRRRYGFKGCVLLEAVGNGAGFGNSGWSDAIAMDTWPSRGLRVYGFEVKASRGDWQRELDKPHKNSDWQAHCHEWYVVAPKGVVELAELPAAWGLMVPAGKDALRIASRSEKEEEVITGAPLGLLAAVFRAAGNYRTAVVTKDRRLLRKELKASMGEELQQARKARDDAEEKWHALASAIGSSWDSLEELRATATLVKMVDAEDYRQRAERMATELDSLAARLRSAAGRP